MGTVPMETYWMIDEHGDPVMLTGAYNGNGWHIVGHGVRRMGVDVFLSREEAQKIGETAKQNTATWNKLADI